MHGLSEERKGELYLAGEIFLWGFFPVVVVLSYASVPTFLSLAWSTAFAAVFFGLVIAYKNLWHEFRNTLMWRYVLISTFFIGILYYGFYFAGLVHTTPGNAALIGQFEVFTAFAFFNVWRKEHFTFEYRVGALLMIIGVLTVLSPNFTGINLGDFLILAATVFAPPGNFFQQKARRVASSETILFLRSVISVVFFFLFAQLFHEQVSVGNLTAVILFLGINGVLLLGLSKILWLEAIHRISVTKAIALGSAAPFLTLLFSWAMLGQAPTLLQLVALVPLILGTLLLTDQISFKRQHLTTQIRP
ncbi:DMT family transporter [Candidatus Kaiserbacteria bacterium]|nr:DMT family transporter [Candidatus Kaiserbacteria bacterium]